MYLSIITPPLYDIIHSQNDCYSKMNSNLMISVTKLSLVNLLLIIIKFSFICEGQPCRVRIINSKWHLFHLCHRRSSSWQSAVPTETTKLALWQLSVFRANMKVIISQYGVHTQWINLYGLSFFLNYFVWNLTQPSVPTVTTKLALWQLTVFSANMKVITNQYKRLNKQWRRHETHNTICP